MKAIVWKELREHMSSGVLLLLLVLAPTLLVLRFFAVDLESAIKVFAETMPYTLLYGSIVTALALGVLQTCFDTRRDQWAFLIHRGESATRIFLGKLVAAGILYAIITISPVLICAVYGMRGGSERFPFSWYLLLPMFAAITSAVPVYFATLLAMSWKGLWSGNYFLPIAAPLLSIASFLLVSRATGFVSPLMFSCWLLFAGILGVAAWGAFVRSGESPGRPVIATICLGVPVFTSVFLALVLSVVAVELMRDGVFREDEKSEAKPRDSASLMVNEQGHVFAVEESLSQRKILSIVDLDDPGSRKYEFLVGESSDVLRNSTDRQGELANRLRAAGQLVPCDIYLNRDLWIEQKNRIHQALMPDRHGQILEEIGRHSFQGVTRWIFSSGDGLLYGYELEIDKQNVAPWPARSRLVSIVGPDGFVEPGERPTRRFSRLLVAPSASRPNNTTPVWRAATINGVLMGPVYYLLCEDALYSVNVEQRKVHELLKAPAGKKIRKLTPWSRNEFLVIYGDAIAVHEIRYEPVAGDRNINRDGVALPGKLKYLASIPPELRHLDSDRIGFVKLPHRAELIFVGNDDLTRSHRIVRTQLDGTVVSRRSYDQRSPTQPVQNGTLAEIALILPAGLVALGFSWDAVTSLISGRGPGALVSLSRESGSSVLLMFLTMAAMTAICLGLATRTASKYGFSRSTRRIWQWGVIFFGPAGLLTFWFLRDWPAMEICGQCRKRRPVDRESCPQCGLAFPNPHRESSEILASDQTAESHSAAVSAV